MGSGKVLYSPSHKYVLTMRTDGNLVVYSAAKRALWVSSTEAGSRSFLTVRNDGNVATYATSSGPAIWSTRT
jgi:murein DD-endopeptidase